LHADTVAVGGPDHRTAPCSALAYGFFDLIGWRGLLRIGILPALVVVWIRFYVNESKV
jgi:hypothetical protein